MILIKLWLCEAWFRDCVWDNNMGKNSNKKKDRLRKRRAFKEQQRKQQRKTPGAQTRALMRNASTVVGYLAMNKHDPFVLVCAGPAAFVTPTQEMLTSLFPKFDLDRTDWRIIPVTLLELSKGLEMGGPYCIHRKVYEHIASLLSLPPVGEEFFNGSWIVMEGWHIIHPSEHPPIAV